METNALLQQEEAQQSQDEKQQDWHTMHIGDLSPTNNVSDVRQSSEWLLQPPDLRNLLSYHYDYVNSHHYCFQYNADQFLKTTLLEAAVCSQTSALLHSLAAFACYHKTLKDDKVAFWTYYDGSIKQLRAFLCCDSCDILNMLLAILQLSAIEECLGSRKIMFSHVTAAREIITSLVASKKMTRDPRWVHGVLWYFRFDDFYSLHTMTMSEQLNRREIMAAQDLYEQQAITSNASTRIDGLRATLQLLVADMFCLQYVEPDEQTATERFRDELSSKFERLRMLYDSLLGAVNDCKFEFAAMQKTDLLALDLVVRYVVSESSIHQCNALAIQISENCDILERNSSNPLGTALQCRTSRWIAGHFLPLESKWTESTQRKLAVIEELGYVFPTTSRRQFVELCIISNDDMLGAS